MVPSDLIANSPIAAVVSDPRQADNPIIACNPAFADLTGYGFDEIIGRNCRFLRGEGTEPWQTESLRTAIHRRRQVILELLNYRKDGTTFRNAVMIAPIFDDDSELLYFVGSQMEVKPGATDAPRRSDAFHKVSELSARQREVLIEMAQGRLNKEIAFKLGLSERTVKMHRAALLRALKVKTNAEAIRTAIEAGY